MPSRAYPKEGSRSEIARPFLLVCLLAELAHLCAVLLLSHKILASNIFQLLLPVLAAGICLHLLFFLTDKVARRCWLALVIALGIWIAGQGTFIFLLYRPAPWQGIRPDDALWLLFGLPLLLAVNTTYDEADRTQWLDRAQTFVFFAVLYLLVLLPSCRLSLNNAFRIQNLALVLCCLLRLPICTRDGERRFFARLMIFLVVDGTLETVSDTLYARGWPAGTPLDLAWTLPFALLAALTLRDALLSEEQEKQTSQLIRVVQSMQGLSVAVLVILSLGLSAFLATRSPWLGGIFVVTAVALFALRMNTRERAWNQAHQQLKDVVLQDALTGLGNRILLRNSLVEQLSATSSAGCAVLLFADLDRFKTVNDSFGHGVGDRLLIEVGSRLRAASPDGSVICRLGGDEFVVLTRAHTAAEAQACGATLLDALHRPFELGEHALRCSASIGVVMSTPEQAADDMLRTADQAMYRAKQLGRDRVQVFDALIMAQLSRRWQMEADFGSCVEHNQIEIAFQPLLDIHRGEISGFEALARWKHPDLGYISPAEFIPLAEDTGLILALGAQVLEKACRAMKEWNQLWSCSLSVNVNVSPRQCVDAGLLSTILGTLGRTGLDPSLLRLEITESALLVHENTAKQLLAHIRAHGIHISLDDFGTGYSSLSFLLSLPVDEVKIDRSFVSEMATDPQRREVVRTVVHLGQSLGKRVVAEGVETEGDLRELKAMGCGYAQGWLISKPLAADVFRSTPPAALFCSVRGYGDLDLARTALAPENLSARPM